MILQLQVAGPMIAVEAPESMVNPMPPQIHVDPMPPKLQDDPQGDEKDSAPDAAVEVKPKTGVVYVKEAKKESVLMDAMKPAADAPVAA